VEGANGKKDKMDNSQVLSRSWNADPGMGLAGIGLLMQQDGGAESPVFIKSVVAGGACERDGSISVGDGVLAVNGERVIGSSVASIRERIVGPIGSTVTVTFESSKTGEVYERTLMRGNAQAQQEPVMGRRYPLEQAMPQRSIVPASANIPLSRSMDSRSMQPQLASNVSNVPLTASMNENEVSRLKSKISELEAKIGITNDELGRTKSLLDQDRNASMRSVREIDQLQRKNSGQVVELQTALNRSEQTRRELESQVASGRAREEEFHLAFNRAKEQTEAREQYFSDLKRQFEEMKTAYERDLAAAKTARQEADRMRTKAEIDAQTMADEMKELQDKEKERRKREDGIRQLMRDTEDKLVEAKQLEERTRGKSHALHLLFGQWHKDFFVTTVQEQEQHDVLA